MKVKTRFCYIIFAFLNVSSVVFGSENFLCSNESSAQRKSDFGNIDNYVKKIFFAVSYVVHDQNMERLSQLFVKDETLSDKSLSEILSFAIENKKRYEYFFDKSKHVREFTFGIMKNSSINTNESCVEPKNAVTIYAAIYRHRESFTPFLLGGCLVRKVKRIIQIEKVLIVATSNNIDRIDITSKMTNFNYSMFKTRGYCICDDIVDFLKCDKTEKMTENYSLLYVMLFVSFTPILVFLTIRIVRELIGGQAIVAPAENYADSSQASSRARTVKEAFQNHARF